MKKKNNNKKLSKKAKSIYVLNSLFEIFNKNKNFMKKINIDSQTVKKIANNISTKITLNNPIQLNQTEFKEVVKDILTSRLINN